MGKTDLLEMHMLGQLRRFAPDTDRGRLILTGGLRQSVLPIRLTRGANDDLRAIARGTLLLHCGSDAKRIGSDGRA